MSFYRCNAPIMFNYEISNVQLERVFEIRDLGVMFDKTILFTRHIDITVAKAYSMLGFMMRICADFSAVSVFIYLYFSHVRSHLEYVTAIWSLNYDIHINRIESVQKKFFSFCLQNEATITL